MREIYLLTDMSKTIRKSTFETNSSSTHSISIDRDTSCLTSISHDGTITLEGGEFGWEREEYTGALAKANYCALDTIDCPVQKQMLIEVLKEHTGAKEIIFKLEGYIDHQSLGTTESAFEDKETLRLFIFNPRSTLETSNDNDEWYDDY